MPPVAPEDPRSRACRSPVQVASAAFRLLWLALGLALSLLPRVTPAGGPAAAPPAAHWAFRPVTPVRPPDQAAARDSSSTDVSSPIDRFVDAGLAEAGIDPSPPADRRTLIRRVTFDLHGLPPTPAEIDAFVGDPAPDAFSRLVERLLASPRYGERWGRHWMDVVRYADTAGDNADYPIPEIHLYRDYIIRAFNTDKPYDLFVREQLAGDVLAESDPADRDQYADRIVATGFLALSRRYGTGPYELWHLTLENTLETVSQAFMGLNMKCARCHDHKFDPLTMQDYYGLYGMFSSTQFPWAGSEEIASKQFNRQKFVPLVPRSEAVAREEAWQQRIAQLRQDVAALEMRKTSAPPAEVKSVESQLTLAKRELRTLEKPGAPPDLPVAYAVTEGTPADVPVQRRGEPSTPGPVTPRCIPGFLAGSTPFAIRPGSSGRLEFARWLTSYDHPLTARVMVNRIWHHHFGRGLVGTPNNFGTRSDPPSHPGLLDDLALRFVASGWSVKAMHRLILGSRAYQRAATPNAVALQRDPSNRLLARFSRHRLDAEALRDAYLFVAGELDLRPPGPHPFPSAENWTWTQHTPFKDRYESNHRSVYLMTQRLQKHPFLALFDGPDTNASTESRRVSTVPQQALFALNNPFLDSRARSLARRVVQGPGPDSRRLEFLLTTAWGRPPSPEENERLLQGLEQARGDVVNPGSVEDAWTLVARVVLMANAFLYVD